MKIKQIAVALAAFFAWGLSENGRANGWEHTAVPVTALISALGNEDAEIRQRAAHSLGHHHTDQVVKLLIKTIERGEENIRVRQAVFSALGRIGNALAVPTIAGCLKSEQEVSVRTMCAVSLEQMRTPEAEEAVLSAIDDSETPVKLAAISSLGHQQTQLAAQTLAPYLQSEDMRTLLVAIRALGNTRQEEALDALKAFIKAKTDVSTLVEVLRAVAVIGSSSVAEQVKEVLEESDNPRVRRHALITLGSIDKNSVQEGLSKSLKSDDPLMLIQALEIARELDDPSIVSAILSAAKPFFSRFYGQFPDHLKTDPENAIVQLSVINEFLRTIIALDPHHADELFSLAATPTAIEVSSPILLTVAEGLYKARWQGIYGIGYTHIGKADSVIQQGYNDKDSRLRAVATRSMGVNDPTRFRDLALRALQDRVAEVRWQAAIVLGRDAGLSDLAPLINAARDTDARVRVEAVLSLGYLATSQADHHDVEGVLEGVISEDKNARVRASASFALELLRKPS